MTCLCGAIILRSSQQEDEVPTKFACATCTFTWSDTNSKLSCTKNNTQRQLVEMIAWLGLNDKFPHNQTLTGCTLKPHISKQEKPDHLWALMFCNHLWCTPPKDKTGSIAQLSVNTCKMYTTELIVLDNLFNCSLLNRFRYSLSKYLIR